MRNIHSLIPFDKLLGADRCTAKNTAVMQYSEAADTRIAAVPQGIAIGLVGYAPSLEILRRVIPDTVGRIDANPPLLCRIVAEVDDIPNLPRFEQPVRALFQVPHRQTDLHLPGFDAHADEFRHRINAFIFCALQSVFSGSLIGHILAIQIDA